LEDTDHLPGSRSKAGNHGIDPICAATLETAYWERIALPAW